MNLVKLFRRPTPVHFKILLGGLQTTLRGFSDVPSGVGFKKIKREAKKSG